MRQSPSPTPSLPRREGGRCPRDRLRSCGRRERERELSVTTGSGKRECRRSDFKGDEFAVFGRPKDCGVDRGARGPSDDLCVPAYEYHFIDEFAHPPVLHSQIPPGYAGKASEVDPTRADASPWIDKLPVVQSFRRAVAPRRSR